MSGRVLPHAAERSWSSQPHKRCQSWVLVTLLVKALCRCDAVLKLASAALARSFPFQRSRWLDLKVGTHKHLNMQKYVYDDNVRASDWLRWPTELCRGQPHACTGRSRAGFCAALPLHAIQIRIPINFHTLNVPVQLFEFVRIAVSALSVGRARPHLLPWCRPCGSFASNACQSQAP